MLWHLRPLLLQDTDAERAAERLRLSLEDRQYSQTRAVIALVQDLGATLLQGPAPAAALAPSQANTVSLALADVVDHDLQTRWPASALHPCMQSCSRFSVHSGPTLEAITSSIDFSLKGISDSTSAATCQKYQVRSQVQL